MPTALNVKDLRVEGYVRSTDGAIMVRAERDSFRVATTDAERANVSIDSYYRFGTDLMVRTEQGYQSVAVMEAAGVVIRTGVALGGGGTTAVATVPVTPANKRASITAASVSQVLLTANATRAGFVFQNNSSYLMWLNLLGSTAVAGLGSIVITPGSTYTSDSASVSASQISVLCAKQGASFNCSEYSQTIGAAPAKTAIDRSGSITVSNKAQLLMADNISRKGFIIQNVSKYPLFLQEIIDGTANGLSRNLTAYETITSESFGVTTSQFSIIGRTASAEFTALEY